MMKQLIPTFFFCMSNPFALRMAKTLWSLPFLSFGFSECKRVKLIFKRLNYLQPYSDL